MTSSLANWSTSSALGFAAKDTNLQRYVGNSPIWLIDPDGLEGYRQEFRNATPDMPENWQVHHTKQQILKERYLSERGINVDDVQYLRGIDPDVHAEITVTQNEWWKQQACKYGSLEDAQMKIPLKEVEAFEKKLEKEFSGYWIKAGKNQARTVKGIIAKIGVKGFLARFKLGRGGRFARTGITIGAGLGLFLIFNGNDAYAACDAATFNPKTDVGFLQMMQDYETALNEATGPGLTHKTANQLRASAAAFFERFKTKGSEDAINRLNNDISQWVDGNLLFSN